MNVEEEEAWIWVPGAGVREPGPGIQSRSSSRSVTGSVASRNLSAAGHHAGPRDADHPNGDGAHPAAAGGECRRMSRPIRPVGSNRGNAWSRGDPHEGAAPGERVQHRDLQRGPGRGLEAREPGLIRNQPAAAADAGRHVRDAGRCVPCGGEHQDDGGSVRAPSVDAGPAGAPLMMGEKAYLVDSYRRREADGAHGRGVCSFARYPVTRATTAGTSL